MTGAAVAVAVSESVAVVVAVVELVVEVAGSCAQDLPGRNDDENAARPVPARKALQYRSDLQIDCFLEGSRGDNAQSMH